MPSVMSKSIFIRGETKPLWYFFYALACALSTLSITRPYESQSVSDGLPVACQPRGTRYFDSEPHRLACAVSITLGNFGP